VTQYALFRRAAMSVTSAWTALGGLKKNGSSGTVSGVDNCSAAPTVAGVAVPTGMWDVSGSFTPGGLPPVLEMGTKPEMAAAIPIDWDAIVNQNAIQPDIIIPGDTWPSFADPNYWPVIRVNGHYSVPGDGRGILIVTGNATISGSKQWQGIVLAGGTLEANGNNTVEGAVVSGLNEKLYPGTVGESDVGNGTKTYVYDSCNVAAALARGGSLRVIEGTWSDNWTW
jgi:hypothetical protein